MLEVMYKGYIRVLDSPAFKKACEIVSEMEKDNMNQTKIEIKSCNKCPFIVTFNLDTGDMVEGCSYYKVYLDARNKPDFCKVKNIIVEEE